MATKKKAAKKAAKKSGKKAAKKRQLVQAGNNDHVQVAHIL